MRREHTADGPAPAAPARARAPAGPPPSTLELLQRHAGNRATGALLQRWSLNDVRIPVVGTLVGGIAGFLGSLWIWRPWFLQRAHDARQRPIFSAEWDAWGHCVTAAATSAWGTSFETWALGEGREAVQDLFGQDSHEQDSHNQAVGRAIGGAHGYTAVPELAQLCLDAYLAGRLRIGPNREGAWLPWCGPHDVTEHLTTATIFHSTFEHEGRRWFPAAAPGAGGYSPDVGNWVEAVDCGDRGTRRGGHLDHPSTPMPSS